MHKYNVLNIIKYTSNKYKILQKHFQSVSIPMEKIVSIRVVNTVSTRQ